MEINYVLVNGDVSASDKQDAIKKFQEDTKTTVFIGSQAAAGTGVNLQVAGYSIYFSKNHRLGDDIQSEGRNFRGGSIDYHKSVTRIDLVMRDSIDELVDESLANKQEVSDKILNYRR
jgi:SNF2 family DNA or RNA helicase